jgi:hypothetical protein
MRGQLLISINPLYQNSGDYLDIYINNVINKRLYISSSNLYSCPLYVNDVVRIEFTDVSPFVASTLDLIRRDYTTDDEGGNNGINDVSIVENVSFTTYTFTATTVNPAYDFEYRMDVSLLPPPTPSPSPTGTPTPTPTPTPVCDLPIGSVNYEITYNWNIPSNAEQPDIFVPLTARYEVISGGCFDYSISGGAGNITTYSGSTTTLNTATLKGPAGLRNVYLVGLFQYYSGTSTNMYHLDTSYGEIFVNGVSQGTTVWVDYTGFPYFENPDPFYPYVDPQPDAFYKRRYLQFGNINYVAGDTVKIVVHDDLTPLYNDYTIQYDWINSREPGSFTITGRTLQSGGDVVVPQFVTGLTNPSGSFITTPIRKGSNGPDMYISQAMFPALFRCNNSVTDNLNVRTGKLLVNDAEITSETKVISGYTPTFVGVCPTVITANKQFTAMDVPVDTNLSNVKFLISDNFVPPTPTPTPSPSPTVTASPTPTPTPTIAPITWALRYKTSASGTPTGTKQVNNMSLYFNGVTLTRPNFTWTSSANSLYTFPTNFNSFTEQIYVDRDLCRQSGASALTLDQYQLRILINSVEVYNQTTNISNTSIPLCSSVDNRTATSSMLTVNSGDTVVVEYTDIFT